MIEIPFFKRAFKPTITLSSALTSPHLFGEIFAGTSFWTWRAVAKLIDGIPLTEPREIELFEQATGRPYNWQARRAVRRLTILVGRRGGKDRFESAVAVWRAALCTDWRRYKSRGEGAVVILIGLDKKHAAILRSYCDGLLEIPALREQVVRDTQEVIEFKNGASLEIAANDIGLVRGRSAICVIGTETSLWKTTGPSSDEEVITAAADSMAMCPDRGLLIMGSSVYRKKGYMYRKFKELYGNADAEGLCWFTPSKTMNPELPQSVIDEALAENLHKASADFLNVWREDDAAACYTVDAITAAVDKGVFERPFAPNTWYFAKADMASGGGESSAALAIAHREPGSETAKLDFLSERKPPFIAYGIIAEWAKILKSHNIMDVWLDGYGFKLFADEWRKHGIIARKDDYSTAENYAFGQPLVLGGRVRLLDNTTLRDQLLSLERTTVDGREKIETNAHDDVAAAAIGVLVRCCRDRYDRMLRGFQPGADDPPPQPVTPDPGPPRGLADWHKHPAWRKNQSSQKIPGVDPNTSFMGYMMALARRGELP